MAKSPSPSRRERTYQPQVERTFRTPTSLARWYLGPELLVQGERSLRKIVRLKGGCQRLHRVFCRHQIVSKFLAEVSGHTFGINVSFLQTCVKRSC